MLKDEIKLRLLNTNMFIDNKYLELYINLIVNNSDTPRLYGKTQRHHILQRKWYNKNKLTIDNSKSIDAPSLYIYAMDDDWKLLL